MLYINVKKLIKTEYGSKDLHVKLELKRGESIGIKGVTGAGKTTLLNIISGITEPDSGIISFNDIIWWQKSPRRVIPLRKRSIGYFMQRGILYNHMTVRKNILFSGASLDQTDELLHRVGLYAFRDSFPHTLSGGQRQRLLLVRTLAKEKPLLLLDEPFTALDEETTWHMADIIKEIQIKYRITMIVVSHNNVLLSALSDRIFVTENSSLYECNRETTSNTCHGMLRVIDLSKKRKTISA